MSADIRMDDPEACFLRGTQELDKGHYKEACYYYVEAANNGYLKSMESLCRLFLSSDIQEYDVS